MRQAIVIRMHAVDFDDWIILHDKHQKL